MRFTGFIKEDVNSIYCQLKIFIILLHFYLAQEPPVGQGLLVHEVPR
jgi:hypothetical protein